MRALPAFLAALTALVFGACATTPAGPTAGPKPASLASEQLAVPQQGVTEFEVRWEGEVVSPETAMVERATWELVVDGKVVKSGEEKFNLPLAAGQTVPVAIEQKGRYVEDEEGLKALDARSGSLLVALRGKLHVERQGTKDVIDFARSRELRLPRLPIVALREVEGARYNAENVNLIFYLTITNPNPFPLKVDQLRYTADIAGKKLAEGEVAKANTVNPSETDSFEFQVTLDPSTYGPEVKKLIASQKIPYRVQGTLEGDLFKRPLSAEGTVQLRVTK